MCRKIFLVLTALTILAVVSREVLAAPYASGVVVSGTSVSFILNQPAASLTYSINGGPAQTLDGTTKGTKSFNLGSPSDHFSITATDSESTGFLIPTGGQIASVASTGLSQPANQSGTNIISDDSSVLSRYNSPRGVAVSQNPNSGNFGTVYINNTAAGTLNGGSVVGPGTTPANASRTTVGKGLYALHADETDAYGNGDTAVNPTNIDTFPAFATAGNSFGTSVANSAYRLTVLSDGTILANDYSDVNGQVFLVQPNLSGGATTSVNLLAGFGGPATPVDGTGNPLTADATALGPDPGCPAGKCTTNFQNHGSVSASVASGSLSGGNLVLYTLDEDLDSKHFGGSSTTDRNSVWQYSIGGSVPAGGYNGTPTQLAPGVATPTFPTIPNGLIGDFPPGGIVADMTRGPDGKFYLSQNRSAGNQPGLLVFDSNGTTLLFNSLQASQTLLNNTSAVDILTGVGGIDVSPDGKYIAIIEIDNDIAIMPLTNGIPDLSKLLLMDGGTNSGNGRDIAWDAADNLYMVSSGQGMYRVYSPGGNSSTTLSWDGSQYTFSEQLSVGLSGDYNGDGKVDAQDYVLWRKSPSSFGGAGGYTTWRSNFGAGSGAGSSLHGSTVPEPASLALVAVGLIAAAAQRRRQA